MKKIFIIFPFLVLNLSLFSAQTKEEFDKLINEISVENSIGIITTKESKQIISYGEKSLTLLAEFFPDGTLTNIKSDCLERNLTKGEIAIILADGMQRMPYAKLTGMQNCLLEFCKNNPNLIEYYFPFIQKDNAKLFTKKYRDWLKSTERKSKRKKQKLTS